MFTLVSGTGKLKWRLFEGLEGKFFSPELSMFAKFLLR
jgi:hypothetical protein